MKEAITTEVNKTNTNPFQKEGLDYSGIAVGNVEIESSRAVAQAQGSLLLAKRFPRNNAKSYAQIIESCKRKAFAETASYAFPRGGQVVSGPSIRLAEELARCWGNIEFGIYELSQNEGFSEMEAFAWDLETNVKSSQRFTVQHKSLNKSKSLLSDPRDIYERIANDGARRLRARILAILPPDVIDAAVEECKRTLSGNNSEPLADRARKVVSAFEKYGVKLEHIEEKIGNKIDVALPEQFTELQQIYCSIRDGMTKVSDWFKTKSDAANAIMEAIGV